MKKSFIPIILIPILGLLLIYGAWLWFFCRIEVDAGEMCILTAKTGADLPPGQILAEEGQKGIRRQPLPEGRYFRNPVVYDWSVIPAASIPAGKVGIVTSKVGAELPQGQILAPDTRSKGVWKDVLGPGTYRLNPEGYTITLADAVNIPIGYVGIVTSQTGAPAQPGSFAKPGEKGVLQDILQPGLYYINPRAYQVDVLEIGMNQVSIIGGTGSVILTKSQIGNVAENVSDLQNATIRNQQVKRENYLNANLDQAFLQQQAPRKAISKVTSSIDQDVNRKLQKLAKDESVAFGINRFVSFPSRDGFQISLDMTVEFELMPNEIARIYMLYGDLPAVVDKIILPQILSVSRIKGSTYKAHDFINGDGRQAFQTALTEELTRVLKEKYIRVHNAIIREVEIPDTILEPIKQASLSKEQDLTNKARQETARKQADLNTQTALIEQNRLQVQQETEKLVATIAAQAKSDVASIDAETTLAVAQVNLEKARIQAGRTRLLGETQAKAQFLVANEHAKGEKLRAAVFSAPGALADLVFVEKLNPEVDIKIIHAGEGTLWTDLKTFAPAIPVKK